MTVTLRTGHTGDYDAVRALHVRCSVATRARRYHTGTPQLTRGAWERMSAPRAGCTLLATPFGLPERVVAVGHLLYERHPDVAELAVLVEDTWQSHGLGGVLSRRLYGLAHFMGVRTVVAYVAADNIRARRMVQGLARLAGGHGPDVHLLSDSDVLETVLS
ncbi:GNAT family N-acetyltransferase [Streptomyces sp. 4F14]|uniref:GNAT family N-acetyltransferase n=1 Tax=Streptomyces sp. 4F14 TaxID=3394380 RepID=UPI003A898099